MPVKKFDFIKEVYEKKVNIDLLRLMEAWTTLNTYRDEESEEWCIEAILGNYFAYISKKDELFLHKLTEFHSEEELKQMIQEALELEEEDAVNGKLLVDDKQFDIEDTTKIQ